MAIASGIFRRIIYKKETTFNTVPGVATGGQILRRTNSSLALTKATYAASEIRQDAQIADFRHGVRQVGGSLSGQLSPGTYKDFMAALFRKAFAVGATTGAIVTVTAAVGPPGTFTRSAGDYIVDGFKVGDVVRWTGWATTGTANNARNYRITALTSTVMTVTGTGNEVVAAKAAGDSVTCTVVGKKLLMASSSPTNDSFWIEDFHSDVTRSEQFGGCRVNTIRLGLPATGLATIDIDILGADMTTSASAFYSSPSTETTAGIVAAVNGVLRVNGVDVATVTNIQLTITGGMSVGPVVGANVTPDVFQGILQASGTFSAYFQDDTYTSLFLNETEIALEMVLYTSTAINADFINIYIPRLKLGGATKDDGAKGLIQNIPFTAITNNAGATNTDYTTVMIQDSLA